MPISLWLLCSEWAGSTVVILEKQISRQNVWFKCCHCKQLLNQKSDWLQTISCHTERFLTVSVRELCLQTFSSISLHCIVVSISVRKIQLFSVWSKTLKNSIYNADRYLVNFMKNQKRTSHLSCTRMKFWERQIMYLYLIKKWFETSF